MAEGSYEAACMRAELLGLDKPNESDFVNSHQPQRENLEAAQFEEISLQNDDLNRASGGLTELNTILSGTQKKLNKLKGVYGSFSELIKTKLSGSKGDISYSTDPSYIPNSGDQSSGAAASSSAKRDINDALSDLETMQSNQNRGVGRDINQKISSQVDKLDSLLTKADNAQHSLDHQNKQMRGYLK